MKRVLLIVTVALVMAAMALVVAMPAFARANPCETGDTPSSPPAEGAAPTSPTPESPPGYVVREPMIHPPQAKAPFTGPDPARCDNSL